MVWDTDIAPTVGYQNDVNISASSLCCNYYG